MRPFTCKFCRFWDKIDESHPGSNPLHDYGECHGGTPQPQFNTSHEKPVPYVIWPLTLAEDLACRSFYPATEVGE